eukprot:scaffold40492_cov24-Phaeocystis_antarctica.AAC.1
MDGTDVHDDRTSSAVAAGVTRLGHAAVLRGGGGARDPDHGGTPRERHLSAQVVTEHRGTETVGGRFCDATAYGPNGFHPPIVCLLGVANEPLSSDTLVPTSESSHIESLLVHKRSSKPPLGNVFPLGCRPTTGTKTPEYNDDFAGSANLAPRRGLFVFTQRSRTLWTILSVGQ